MNRNDLLAAVWLGGAVGAFALLGCSGSIESSGGVPRSGTAGAAGSGATATGGTGDSGAGGASGTATGPTGGIAGTVGSGGASGPTGSGPGGNGGSGQGGAGQAGSGQSGSGGAGGARDAGGPIADGAIADRAMGIDTGPIAGCMGALMGPPDYSRDNTGTPVAGSDANQLAALVRANHWRTPGGLTPLNANAAMQQASVAHAHFMSVNPSGCYPGSHQEAMTSGGTTCVGFTGVQPWDRLTAAGYQWSTVGEVIDSASDGTAAVDEWIWTVYHREPFLDAQYLDIGFGLENKNAVMDFAARSAGSTTKQIVFPLPGQTGVKPDFNGSQEGPTPKPPATKGWPSGTVISVTFSGAYTIVSHQLYDAACQPVVHTAHGAFDGDTNAGNRFFYMFADAPLPHGATYTASVSAMVGGAAWSETWAFVTQ